MPSEIDRMSPLSDRDLMERYGISREPADYFHHGQYRYTRLKDAIAEAVRDESKGAMATRKSTEP